MKTLYSKLKKYSLDDAIDFEQSDRQFLALWDLYKSKSFTDDNYLFLTIANALVCYQLSGKGEDYWEEFSEVLKNKKIENFADAESFFTDFLPVSKNNKRFVNVKLGRIKKLEDFYLTGKVQPRADTRLDLWEQYYKDMNKLANDLARVMNQKADAKTIIFAVKMFSYSARNVFGYLEYFPETLMIPIDSRLENLYKKYNNQQETTSKKDVKEFYVDLSKKLNIPLLHLDAILWVNYDELMNF